MIFFPSKSIVLILKSIPTKNVNKTYACKPPSSDIKNKFTEKKTVLFSISVMQNHQQNIHFNLTAPNSNNTTKKTRINCTQLVMLFFFRQLGVVFLTRSFRIMNQTPNLNVKSDTAPIDTKSKVTPCSNRNTKPPPEEWNFVLFSLIEIRDSHSLTYR